ncbi:mannitol dehydrogenase family protein, partial [Mycolicibacterium pulveris]
PIDVQDQLADILVPLARSQHDHPTAFIENTAVFGDLARDARFVEAYLWALDSLHRDGARATLEELLRKDTP